MKKLKSLGHNVKESVLHKSLEEAHNVEQMRKDRRYQQKYPPELVDKYVQKMIEIFNLPPKTPMFFRLIAPCSNWENERKEWMNGELVITRKNLCFISDDYHQSASRSQVKSVKKNEIKKGENELVVKYGDHEMKLKNLTPDNEKRAIKIIGHFAKNSDKKSLRSSLLGVPSRKKKKDSDSDSDSEITDLSDISADEHDELEHDEAARTSMKLLSKMKKKKLNANVKNKKKKESAKNKKKRKLASTKKNANERNKKRNEKKKKKLNANVKNKKKKKESAKNKKKKIANERNKKNMLVPLYFNRKKKLNENVKNKKKIVNERNKKKLSANEKLKKSKNSSRSNNSWKKKLFEKWKLYHKLTWTKFQPNQAHLLATCELLCLSFYWPF